LYITDGYNRNLEIPCCNKMKVKQYIVKSSYCLFEEANEPLEKMSSNKAFRIVLAWIAERMKHTIRKIVLQKHNDSKTVMTYIGLRLNRSSVYVNYVHDVLSKPSHCAYVWKPHTTFNNLTTEEIKNSAKRAHELDYGLVELKKVQFDERLDKEINEILDEIVLYEAKSNSVKKGATSLVLKCS